MDRSLMKRKLRWNSQFQVQSSSQERSNMAFEGGALKSGAPLNVKLRGVKLR